MLPFQRLLSRRWRFDTEGDPDLVLPDYNGFLEHVWALEEDGTADRVDSVGDLDMVVQGGTFAPYQVTGKNGYGNQFVDPGGSDRVYIRTNDSFSEDSIAISFWLRLDSASSYEDMAVLSIAESLALYAVKNVGTTSDWSIEVWHGTNELLHYGRGDGDGDLALDTWYHVCIFDKKGVQYLAINGIMVRMSEGTGSEANWLYGAMDVGASLPFSTYSLNGTVDEIYVWCGINFPNYRAFSKFSSALHNGGDGVFYDAGAWVEVV